MVVYLGVLGNINYGPTLKNQNGRHFSDWPPYSLPFYKFVQKNNYFRPYDFKFYTVDRMWML